eukprot:2119882-Amphidinium_carterae.1
MQDMLNGDITKWDTSNVYNTHRAFYDASSFNQNIARWSLLDDTWETDPPRCSEAVRGIVRNAGDPTICSTTSTSSTSSSSSSSSAPLLPHSACIPGEMRVAMVSLCKHCFYSMIDIDHSSDLGAK